MNKAALIAPALLAWYDACARVLPWRTEPSPYGTLVSELMLQQTRVDTVIPKYNAFLARFPSFQALASAGEDEVLKAWEGLGYYSRARNLHRAAKLVVEQYGGVLPSDPAVLRTLPGIGPYCAGSVASIGFGVRAPAVDGNVLRVFARLQADFRDILLPAVRKDTEKLLLDEVLPFQRVGDFNQALMELGALVCIPAAAPRCSECPLQAFCAACEQGVQEQLPVRGAAKPRRKEEKTFLLYFRGGEVAVQKRPAHGLLANLWEFPWVKEKLNADQVKDLVPYGTAEDLGKAEHIFSHLEWHMQAYALRGDGLFPPEGVVWVSEEQLEKELAFPSALRLYVRQAIRLLKEEKRGK